MSRELSRREFMRRISAGGVVIVGGAAIPSFLAACSGAGPAGSQSPTGPIAFLTPPWGVTDPDQQKKWEASSKITVTTTAVPNEQVYQKVQLGLSSSSYVADVIFESEEAPSFEVASGAMAPLDDFIAKEAATFNAEKITNFGEADFKKDGKVVGITAYIQNGMMDYNAKKLGAAGFNNPPATWDELVAQAQAVKDKGVERFPIAFAAIFWSWFPMAMSMGDPLFNDKQEPTFNAADSAGRKAMKMLVDMFDRQLISPDLVNAGDPHASFLSGIGTFHQSWLGAHAVMNNPKVSKQAPDVRYMIYPEQHWGYPGDSAIGISKHAKNSAAAWEFIKFYMGAENQRHLFDAFGLVPSLKSVVAAINTEGKNQQPEVQEEQLKYLRPLPRSAKFWGPWTTFMNETIKRAFLHQVTPDQAVDQIAAKWTELKGGG